MATTNRIVYNVKTKSTTIEEYVVDDKAMELARQQAEKEQRKLDILMELQSLDYKTLEYIEGYLSDEDFVNVKTQKNLLRQEYHALQSPDTVIKTGQSLDERLASLQSESTTLEARLLKVEDTTTVKAELIAVKEPAPITKG